MERLGLVVVSPRRPSVGRRPRSCSWLGPWRSFEAVELATLETGGLVQQPAGLGAHWEHPAGRSRGTPLRYAGAISHGGVTRNGLCQTRRRSVGTKYKDTSLVADCSTASRSCSTLSPMWTAEAFACPRSRCVYRAVVSTCVWPTSFSISSAEPLGVVGGVDPENEPGHLVLAQSLVIGVEEANVGFVMPGVVLGDAVRPGGLRR